ncbi:ChaB family protein [Pseudoalteromonas sp. SaAl2]
MPYQNTSELPDSVKSNLPKHAQEIYQEAFNSAWDTYEDPSDRKKR